MARTKLTARPSTGGKAPRRHLATRFAVPDASWTVPRLKAEAEKRGIPRF